MFQIFLFNLIGWSEYGHEKIDQQWRKTKYATYLFFFPLFFNSNLKKKKKNFNIKYLNVK